MQLEQENLVLKDEVAKLKTLLEAQMRTGEELEFEGIVNADATSLVNVRWDQLVAQISTDAAREMAYGLLRVCEWADTDAAILTAARKAFDGDERMAAGVMVILREARGAGRERSAPVPAAHPGQSTRPTP